jgi:hypothetical protein
MEHSRQLQVQQQVKNLQTYWKFRMSIAVNSNLLQTSKLKDWSNYRIFLGLRRYQHDPARLHYQQNLSVLRLSLSWRSLTPGELQQQSAVVRLTQVSRHSLGFTAEKSRYVLKQVVNKTLPAQCSVHHKQNPISMEWPKVTRGGTWRGNRREWVSNTLHAATQHRLLRRVTYKRWYLTRTTPSTSSWLKCFPHRVIFTLRFHRNTSVCHFIHLQYNLWVLHGQNSPQKVQLPSESGSLVHFE